MKQLFFYSVDIYNYQEEVYTTYFAYCEDENDAAEYFDGEYMKNLKLYGPIPTETIMNAALHINIATNPL